MVSYKREFTAELREEIKKFLETGEVILHEFEVVPIDYGIQDFRTPKIFITKEKLIFTFDETFEVYLLNELEISIFGEAPKFTVWQQFLEGDFRYEQGDTVGLEKIKASEVIVRFVFNEDKHVPKEFILRKGIIVAKNSQTWAMAQTILNTKNRLNDDPILREIMDGRFTRFNQRTILVFIVIFLGFFVLKLLGVNVDLPDLFNSIIDWIFGIVLIGMIVWTVLSINKNLERYKACYYSYYMNSTPVTDSVQ
jgi:hypothetical protein